MQTTFVFEMDFNDAVIVMNTCPSMVAFPVRETVFTYNPSAQYELRAFCMYDTVIAFDETSGSVRAEC